jgi:hypothetical protein
MIKRGVKKMELPQEVFICQIRAQQTDGTPYDYWINVCEFQTLEESRISIEEYRNKYKKTRDVNNNSRIMKVTKEVVI